MKTSRLVFLLTLFLCGVTSPVVQATETPSQIVIELKSGEEIRAVLVEPWPQDFIRLTNATEERTFVPLSKIRAIRDDQGRDRTKDVLVRRQTVGKAPSEPIPPADTSRVITTPISSFVVQKDSVLVASRVERIGSERIVATRVDGIPQSLPAYEVRWIRGLDGQDYRNAVVNHGKAVEENPILVGYPGPRSSSYGLRGRPKPECSGFPFVQAGFLGRLSSEQRYIDPGTTALVQVGGMKNIDRHWSLGANGFFGTDRLFTRVGFGPRGRLWITPSATVDAAAGILYADALEDGGHSSTAKPGYSAELAIGFKDLVSATAVLESFDETYQVRGEFPLGRSSPITFHEHHTSVLLGIKFGGPLSFPAFIAAMALAATPMHQVIY